MEKTQENILPIKIINSVHYMCTARNFCLDNIYIPYLALHVRPKLTYCDNGPGSTKLYAVITFTFDTVHRS